MGWGLTNLYRYYGSADTKPSLDVLRGCKLIAVDTETYNATETVLCWLGIAYSPTDSFGFSMLPPDPDIPWWILRDPSVTKIFHNAPFDLRVLRDFNVDTANVVDTAVMARMAVIPANLEDACERMQTLSRPRHMKDVWEEARVNNSIDLGDDANAVKCGVDCLGTYQLYLELEPLIDMDYLHGEMELMPILEKMSKRGIKLDQDIRLGLEYAYRYQLQSLDKLCLEEFGFNPHSPPQVAYILTKRGNFLPGRRAKTTGKWSFKTDEATLEKIIPLEPLAGLILEARHLRKYHGTYLVPYAQYDRAYTYFHLDAGTARISSSSTDPSERNLQNIPKAPDTNPKPLGMRNMFIPDSGYFTDTDLSQIELRVLAYIANDRRMQEVLDDPDGDIHQMTADYLHVPRRTAKNCTFAIIYGATAQTVMETAHIADLRLAQRMLDMIFRLYPGLGDWIRSTQEFGVHHEYIVTMGGRRISVVRPEEAIQSEDDARTRKWKTAAIQRKSSNYPIQASAAEVMKRMLKVADTKGVLAHQVHDQVIWDGVVGQPEDVQGWFDNLAPFRTPVKTVYTDRWE